MDKPPSSAIRNRAMQQLQRLPFPFNLVRAFRRQKHVGVGVIADRVQSGIGIANRYVVGVSTLPELAHHNQTQRERHNAGYVGENELSFWMMRAIYPRGFTQYG